MRVMEYVLRAVDFAVGAAVTLFLVIAGAYSIYALWDNTQVYAAAEEIQTDMLRLKPETAQEEGASFEELLAVNPDVRAWLTLDGTEIDYPVLQGESNLSYINTDVYGDFALAGSIFLDSGCDGAFGDAYSLLYGHHMEEHRMFGDLDLYREETFFDGHSAGTLLLPDRTYELEIFACLLVPASEDAIFEPEQWRDDIEGLLEFAEGSALHIRQETVEEMRQGGAAVRILGMSTCSSEFTDARIVVLARMKPDTPET
ncbi:MAG: class B sortase [Eubacteriales bacterium]|nr:class B sortase [Eubacteriales bacterium]